MLKKALLLEATVIVCMVGTQLRMAEPTPRLTSGDASFCIQETPAISPKETPAAVDTLPTLPAPIATPPPRSSSLHFPVQGLTTSAVISVFGDKRGSSRLHQGIDVEAPRGTPVVAVADGTIVRRREGGNGGRQLYLRDGEGRLYYYAHLDDWSVTEGQSVQAGEVLGTVGNTGNASHTLPHLHFEVMPGRGKRAVDPLQFWVRP